MQKFQIWKIRIYRQLLTLNVNLLILCTVMKRQEINRLYSTISVYKKQISKKPTISVVISCQYHVHNQSLTIMFRSGTWLNFRYVTSSCIMLKTK